MVVVFNLEDVKGLVVVGISVALTATRKTKSPSRKIWPKNIAKPGELYRY